MAERTKHTGVGQGRSGDKPDDFQRARLRLLRAALAERNLDALLTTNPSDILYLTGFSIEDSAAIILRRSVIIVSDFRFEEQLARLTGRIRIVIRSGELFDAVGTTLCDEGLQRIGVQPERLTLAARRAIARHTGARRLIESPPLLAVLRAQKDEHEIRAIRRAVGLQQAALLATLEQAAPGMREIEFAALLEFEMKSRAAQGISFPTIVAAGANGSLPHHAPSGACIGAGKPLLIDWGARVNGYCADMTRTFAFTRWPRRLREIYAVVLDAMDAAVDAIRPGAACREIDRVARGIIEAAGCGPRFGHGLGHGVGLDVHEAPRLSRQSEDTLLPGMVVTVEPGVYIPGLGGVRIEDDVLVTDRGAKRLSTLPRDIEWATR